MKKLAKRATLALAQVATLLSVFAVKAHAASITAPLGGNVSLSLNGLVNLVIKVVFAAGIVICVVFLVIYGIKYITAGDDVKAIEGARKGITGAIIGLIVIILTFAIIKLVATFFGINSGSIFNILPDSYTNPA